MILKDGVTEPVDHIISALKGNVKTHIGSFAVPQHILVSLSTSYPIVLTPAHATNTHTHMQMAHTRTHNNIAATTTVPG